VVVPSHAINAAKGLTVCEEGPDGLNRIAEPRC
jgi:hypothetical protein